MRDIDTTTNLAYTYVFDKYSCVREFYFIHIFFNYLIAFSGLFCFISRLWPRFSFLHIYLGKSYILFMLLSTASSMLIHNTGLPLGVLISFVWVIGGLTIGQVLIWRHQYLIHQQATENVTKELIKLRTTSGIPPNFNLANRINKEKGLISMRKDLKQRMISYKAFHGAVMFMSWINIVGRIFASNQSGDFVCYTTPVYKNAANYHFPDPSSTNSTTYVPTFDPKYERLPWANKEQTWGVMLSLGPLIGARLVGTVFAYFNLRSQRKTPSAGEETLKLSLSS